jgi:hypothetical protein
MLSQGRALAPSLHTHTPLVVNIAKLSYLPTFLYDNEEFVVPKYIHQSESHAMQFTIDTHSHKRHSMDRILGKGGYDFVFIWPQ